MTGLDTSVRHNDPNGLLPIGADPCQDQSMTNTETAIPDYTKCHTATPRTIELLFAPVVDVFDVVAVMADIHGSDAASWVFDDCTTDATYRRFAEGLDDGDPEIMDQLPFLDLSGEWADGLTDRDIIAEVVGFMGDTDPDDVDPDTADAIVDAYVAAYDMAVMQTVDRIAHEHVDAIVRTIPDTGSYIPFAVMDDGVTLCAQCVSDPSNPVHDTGDRDGWRIDGWDHSGNVDTDAVVCAHCGRTVVEAYDE